MKRKPFNEIIDEKQEIIERFGSINPFSSLQLI
jgi:hypothetical protein